MEEEYKSNSNKIKNKESNELVEKKVEKVVTGKVMKKKKSKVKNFFDNFISEDAKNVKSYVFGEVLIPAIKKAIADIVTDGIDIILYGGSRRGNRRSTADRVSYRNYYDDRNRRDYNTPVRSNTSYSYDDIIFDNRGDAEDVLSRMDELMSTYGIVRVADLYDLAGITGNYTDNKYGWTNITSAEVARVRDGFTIRMPRAMPID